MDGQNQVSLIIMFAILLLGSLVFVPVGGLLWFLSKKGFPKAQIGLRLWLSTLIAYIIFGCVFVLIGRFGITHKLWLLMHS
jgi:hypothetical protein